MQFDKGSWHSGAVLLLLGSACLTACSQNSGKLDSAAAQASLDGYAPPLGSQQIWDGVVKAPSWSDHVRLLLIRKGDEFTGWSWYPESQFDREPFELRGTLQGSEVRIEDSNVYKGKFESPSVMTGKRPNGSQPGDPEFPFRFTVVRNAEPSDFPPPLPSTTEDWQVFLTRFKAAVQRHDRDALQRVMSRHFQFESPTGSTPNQIFDTLKWQDLSRVISSPIHVSAGAHFELEGRFAKVCLSNKCTDWIEVDFQKGRDRQWRWSGFNYVSD